MEASPHLPTPEQELAGEHGEVFTRRWVVDLILDLVGYDERLDLARLTAVEPSCGQAPS
jgi:type I restriction-modification system DNA methylase subunit